MWMSRYILLRCAELYNVEVTLDPKPIPGDWNGAGGHVNFSNNDTRAEGVGWDNIQKQVEKLGKRHAVHIAAYGEGNERRLTGKHETSSMNDFSWGVANRGCSIRVGRMVPVDKCGYYEDRRPASNLDPYVVTRLLVSRVEKVFLTPVVFSFLPSFLTLFPFYSHRWRPPCSCERPTRRAAAQASKPPSEHSTPASGVSLSFLSILCACLKFQCFERGEVHQDVLLIKKNFGGRDDCVLPPIPPPPFTLLPPLCTKYCTISIPHTTTPCFPVVRVSDFLHHSGRAAGDAGQPDLDFSRPGGQRLLRLGPCPPCNDDLK
jgi:hypothetical protein